MKIGKTFTMPQPGTMDEHIQQYRVRVLAATSQLFYLLDAAETLQRQAERGEREQDPVHRGFGPSMLRVELRSEVPNVPTTWEQELGPNGRLVQLAYVGWIAAIDGAWDKARAKPPYRGGLKHGQQANLFGDLHKIRNDLLKNGAIAQAKNVGRCTELTWFEPGDFMHLRIEHVLDFLHRLGGYLRSCVSSHEPLCVDWCFNEYKPLPASPPPVISNRAFIADHKEPISQHRSFALCVSMVFADGVACVCPVKEASDHDSLIEDMKALNTSPSAGNGTITALDINRMQLCELHDSALRTLRSGDVPADAGTPWIRVGGPQD